MGRWTAPSLLVLLVTGANAFQVSQSPIRAPTWLSAEQGRRNFVETLAIMAGAATSSLLIPDAPASASVFLDPAMYGDQELRVAAVDSLRERVRQSILRKPSLAPSFYQMALLDGLSYDVKSREYGPDGRVVRAIFSSKNNDEYTNNLKEAATVLIEAAQALKKYTAITIGDAVAISGAQAIESLGGPVLSVQLGRTEPPKNVPLPKVPLNLFDGSAGPADINDAFNSAGLTSREMTALMTTLLTLERVEKTRSPDDWRAASRPKFRERGKMGRMSEFKRLTEDEIAAMTDEYDEDPDDGWYISDSFGTRREAFGSGIEGGIDEKTFNKYIKEIQLASTKKNSDMVPDGYIEATLLDKSNPPVQSWLNKYAGSNLSYIKDLGIAYNSMTQLGAEFTGGKYENLLKNKPRKTLNDDDLGLF